MPRHVYLRAYMAGVTVPSVIVLFMLGMFCALRFGWRVPIDIERGLVFPLAIVPCLWGLWNMLYMVLRRHVNIPLGIHGAVVPLFAGPLALATAWMLGFDIPQVVLSVFPVVVAVAIVAYYLVWKYLVAFFNRMLEIG